MLAGTLMAQSTGAGTLVGTVSDSTGAVIAGAKVNVVNADTAFLSESATSAEGAYRVPYLAPGTYKLTIEASGFKMYVRDGIIIRTGEVPRIDVALELGAVTDTVTVTGAPPLLETETSSSGTILSGGELVKMPISQKTTQRMMLYYAGTSAASGLHVLGQRQNAIGYTLDGVSGKEPGVQSFGGTDTHLSSTQDAFQEVKVYTTGTPAEFGHSAGGLMSVVFKSGGNQFHGSAEDRYLGQTMIHRSYLEQLQPTAPFVYHEITAVLSGPVILPKYNGRDKTFWLFGFAEHYENGGTNSAQTAVPMPAMYNGDFSLGGQTSPKVNAIYNPFTTRLNGATWVNDPFPGNQIPKSLFDPSVQKFLAQNPFSQPNQAGVASTTGPTLNLVANQQKQIRRTRWDAKIDHQFTPNHKIFGRYSEAMHRAWKGDYQAQFNWRDIDPNAQPVPVDQFNGVLSDMAVLSPTTNNEFRIGYNRRSLSQQSLLANQDWASKLGIPNVSGATFPYFSLGATSLSAANLLIANYGMAGLPAYQNVGEDFTMQDNFTKVTGKHTLKFGYELIRTRYNATSQVLPGGQYNFGGTEAPFTPNTGIPFASFLLGTVTSATFTNSSATWLPRWFSHQAYIQDDWKPISNLTINIGLRYSYETPFQTKYNQDSQFDPTIKDSVTGLMGAITHPTGALSKKDLNNFAPRIGLAWSFSPKWVFRSSFGVIHQDAYAVTAGIMFDEYLATANIQQPTGDPRYAFKLSDGPGNITYRTQANGSVPYVGTNYSSRNASWWDPNMRLPYVMSWSGGLQWEFAHGWLTDMSYQGQSGVGLINSWDINAIPLNVSNDPATLQKIYTSTQNYKPYPQFGSVNLYSNFGHDTHHAGTVRVEKRYSAGLSLNAFYTYSKSISDVDAEGAATGITYYNRSLEKARTAFDITHHFVSILSYELPIGKGKKLLNRGGIVDKVLGGWEATYMQTFQSGSPFTLAFSNSPNKYLPGNSRPNVVTTLDQALTPNWTIGANRFPTSAQTPYLNINSFAYPAAFTPGNLGRNTFEGPGLNWYQISLGKWWKVKERARFQLRIDGYNWPIKYPNYANPTGAGATYNTGSPGTFARITAVTGSYSGLGSARPNFYVIGRFEF